MKKVRKAYLLVRAALAAVTDSEIENHSNNTGSFLPHIKSKMDFWINRCFSSKQGFRSLCSFHLLGPPPSAGAFQLPICTEQAVRERLQRAGGLRGHTWKWYMSCPITFLWPELSYFINKAREATR